MRFIHISDLHIGKRLFGYSLIEDQIYILSQIVEISKEKSVDSVIIAGDIYDKSVPTAEAVAVFDQFLTNLCQAGKKVFIISGNHDNAERIAYGSHIMQNGGVYISPVYDGSIEKIELNDKYGKINIYLVPFIKPVDVKQFYPEENCENFTEAFRTVISHIEVNKEERNVIVCHQFVTGARMSGSEGINVGTLDNIDCDIFSDFEYCALGHIHGKQNVQGNRIRYCGTPLKYSFSEANQEKTVSIVEICKKEDITIEIVKLKPLRDLRILRGKYSEITDAGNYRRDCLEDYVKVVLTDEDEIPYCMEKLRSIYPNIMQLEYDNSKVQKRIDDSFEIDAEKSPFELFKEFFKAQNDVEMNTSQQDYVKKVIKEIWEAEQ